MTSYVRGENLQRHSSLNYLLDVDDSYSENPQQDATGRQSFTIPYFKWGSTCFGRHAAHHQEPKTAQAASGFVYVEGCWTCSCFTLSGSVHTLLNNVQQLHVQQPSTYAKP